VRKILLPVGECSCTGYSIINELSRHNYGHKFRPWSISAGGTPTSVLLYDACDDMCTQTEFSDVLYRSVRGNPLDTKILYRLRSTWVTPFSGISTFDPFSGFVPFSGIPANYVILVAYLSERPELCKAKCSSGVQGALTHCWPRVIAADPVSELGPFTKSHKSASSANDKSIWLKNVFVSRP
jgi:hypothetical protein